MDNHTESGNKTLLVSETRVFCTKIHFLETSKLINNIDFIKKVDLYDGKC